MSALCWTWLGRVAYRAGLADMERRRQALVAGEAAAAILLLEHDPVITLGRHASECHVLASRSELARRGIEVLRTSRGGEVTYHGPGQLMVYPIVRVRRSVVDCLEAVAGALADVVAQLGVGGAFWRRERPGLWLGDRKLASCGIHLRRGVIGHGFALNLATPADAWRAIAPCGLDPAVMTSVAAQARVPLPPMAEVAAIAGPFVCRALHGHVTAA